MEDTKKIVNGIIAAAQDKKAKDIVVVDMTKMLGAICQYFVVCEGNTPSQVTAITDNVIDVLKKELNERPISTEGEREARWVGIDYGTVIVHVFIPELREFYKIENLWEDAALERIPNID